MARTPLLARAYVAAMRTLGALGIVAAALLAPVAGIALAAPLGMIGFVTLLAAQGISGRWIVGSAICIGATLGEIAFGGMLLTTNLAMWQWAIPLILVAAITSSVLLDRGVRAWLEPRVATFEVVTAA